MRSDSSPRPQQSARKLRLTRISGHPPSLASLSLKSPFQGNSLRAAVHQSRLMAPFVISWCPAPLSHRHRGQLSRSSLTQLDQINRHSHCMTRRSR